MLHYTDWGKQASAKFETADDLLEEFIRVFEDSVIWEKIQEETRIYYRAAVTPQVNEGILIRNDDGFISWSADGTDWTTTDVASAFTDADYAKDNPGQSHGRLYGSTTYTESEPDPDPEPDRKPHRKPSSDHTETKPSSETVKNEDGSTTMTVTDPKTGMVTEITASVPGKAAREAAESGEPVTLPLTLPVVTDSRNAVPVEIDAPASVEAFRIEIPVERVTPGTVAILVQADGTETVVKTSLPSDTGIILTISGDTTIKIVDNGRAFDDVPAGNWAEDAVAFVTARELFLGKTETAFAPAEATTRAQLMTVLARLDGADGIDSFDQAVCPLLFLFHDCRIQKERYNEHQRAREGKQYPRNRRKLHRKTEKHQNKRDNDQHRDGISLGKFSEHVFPSEKKIKTADAGCDLAKRRNDHNRTNNGQIWQDFFTDQGFIRQQIEETIHTGHHKAAA